MFYHNEASRYALRLFPVLHSATIPRAHHRADGAGCGCSPFSTRLQYRQRHSTPPTALRLFPVLHSATMLRLCGDDTRGCGCSPFSTRLQWGGLYNVAAYRCGCSPFSTRLQSTSINKLSDDVAVVPRSPLGYNCKGMSCGRYLVAVVPRSPLGYNMTPTGRVYALLRLFPVLHSATIVLTGMGNRALLRLFPVLHSATISQPLQ